MRIRTIIFLVILLAVSSVTGFVNGGQSARGNTGRNENVKTESAGYADEYKYVYVWIDGVRWMFVYDMDGAVVNSYPDPEY